MVEYYYNFVCPTCHSHYNIEVDRFVCSCGQTFRRNDATIADKAMGIPSFLTYYVELLATIAKIDGVASQKVIDTFNALLVENGLSANEIRLCLKQFHAQPLHTYEKTMLWMLLKYNKDEGYKAFMLYHCLRVAFANGNPSERQLDILDDIVALFGISESLSDEIVEDVLADINEPIKPVTKELNDYELLGVKRGCTQDELKRAYRHLMKSYHPDKIEAIDLPKELKYEVTQKAIQIQKAYELIKLEEGFAK